MNRSVEIVINLNAKDILVGRLAVIRDRAGGGAITGISFQVTVLDGINALSNIKRLVRGSCILVIDITYGHVNIDFFDSKQAIGNRPRYRACL